MAMNAPWTHRNLSFIPMMKNEFDKCTVFSVYPREIIEHKITIIPSRYVIPAGTLAKPGALIVEPASWWKEIWESDQCLEIPQHSAMVADSLINDWSQSLLGADAHARPGLFYVPGAYTVEKGLKEFPDRFKAADEMQRRYFRTLVNMADVLWSRTNANPLSIGDNMRLAARELGLNTKEWLQNYQAAELVKCSACGSPRNALYPICPTCKAVVDPVKAKELGLKFAE